MASRPVTPHKPATSVYGDEFSKGRSYANWRPRGSGDWLLIYTVNGGGSIGTSRGAVRTRPGDLLLYEPQAPQDYRTFPGRPGRWDLLWAHFIPRAHWHLWLQWPEIALQTRLVHLPAGQRPACAQALRRMILAIRRPGPIQSDLALAALEEVILQGRSAQAREQEPSTDPRIARATLLLTDRFKEPFELPALARQCGLSVSRFSHLFRGQVGLTPGQFLERQRLAQGAQMLRLTFLTVSEIAAECGFESPFYFTHRFRRRYGVSPSAFRFGKEGGAPLSR